MRNKINGILFTAMAGLIVCSTGCRDSNVGLDNDKLKPCPDSPNCVSSMSEDLSHYIEPFKYEGTPQEAMKKLLLIIKSLSRTQVIVSENNYIHAEFKSMVFRFVDDVEFYFDDQAAIIHVRSASRVGYSDFGANRKRIEKIREQFSRE
jgi:uncharacterized protein (DUF1499 family)